MLTTLGEFHTLVSDALGRGTSLDSVIPRRVGMAANWIERNYTFQYMRSWELLSVDPDADFPHILSLAGKVVKKIECLRRRQVDAAGTGFLFSRPLRQVKPADRETRAIEAPGSGAGTPESFWLNGVSSLVLSSIPDEDMVFEAHLVLLTRWGSGDAWTHWLLDNAPNLLLSRTLMLMTSRTRDPKMYDMYKADLELELAAFNVAEEDLQSSEPVAQTWEPVEYVTQESLRSA